MRETPLLTMLSDITTSFMFTNIGLIKKIHNENYIDVALYWTDNMDNEVVIPDVRLLQLGTTKCKLFIQPAIGDNVLLICPRDFVEKLEFNRKAENIGFANSAYSSKNMCAILIKDEGDDNVKTSVHIDENGNISVETDGEANVSAENIILNGGENNSHLVRYEELEAGLSALWAVVKTHTHPYTDDGSPATTSPSAELSSEDLDISEAKTDTLQTEQYSS